MTWLLSDKRRVVKITVLLAKQKKEHKQSSIIHLEDSILYMPNGKGCVIRTE